MPGELCGQVLGFELIYRKDDRRAKAGRNALAIKLEELDFGRVEDGWRSVLYWVKQGLEL